jgi:hypothetical protein
MKISKRRRAEQRRRRWGIKKAQAIERQLERAKQKRLEIWKAKILAQARRDFDQKKIDSARLYAEHRHGRKSL